MSPEDIRKLLGGYATGTLTAEEQQALFAAALEDQELFDALSREQPLRDLLRDPAARAELLSALDTPAPRFGGFWQWLRRPAVAGLAMAGVVAIAVVAVWQGTRVTPLKTAPVLVAELKREEAVPTLAPAHPAPSPEAREREGGARDKAPAAPATVTKKERAAANAAEGATSAPPPRPPPAMAEAIQDVKQAQAEKGSATAISAPAPTVMARKSKVEAEAAPGQSLASVGGTPQESATQDARALYYGNQLAVGVNAFVAPSGGVGGAPPAPTEARADVATRSATAISRLAAPAAAGAVRLGLRVSIVRGSGEADLTTVLDPGETVRLKVIPNADGFLYVVGGTRMFASATAQRLKAFETPELSFDGSGQKHLYIVLSHRPETLASLSPGTLARDNVVESSSSQEGATYAVAGPRDTAAVTVVVPVTLTYR